MVTHSYKGEKKLYGGKKYKPHGKKAGKPDRFIKAKGKNMKGKCFWYHQNGHIKIDCFKFENHLEGTPFSSHFLGENSRSAAVVNFTIGSKRQSEDCSSMLWHRRLYSWKKVLTLEHTTSLGHYDESQSDQDDEPLPILNESLPVIYEPEPVMDKPQSAVDEPQPIVDVPLQRSQRVRISAIPDDYIVYLQKHDFDLGVDDDSRTYGQDVQSSQSSDWMDIMIDEQRSMDTNQV
ncbi:hypothetical protein LWI29_012109 [Acer saccharum]|uniref:Uncharacterized protein n=1 Tax=Acer saccharum TaxID=4024 RepID=A0AA39S1Q1_ACESA|nr:hypothetical protein LWI29_012109 [Acer saccharum]